MFIGVYLLKTFGVMRAKSIGTIIFILLLLFITIGDRILPQPLSDVSRNTRTSINKFLIGLFPDKEFTDPSEGLEKGIEEHEQGKSTSD
ncbi:MAG: hypothetical protein AB4426_24465 [Xenococcaceae cyanobacterium]